MKNIVNAWILKRIANESAQVEQIKSNIESSLQLIEGWLSSLGKKVLELHGQKPFFLVHQTSRESIKAIISTGLRGVDADISTTMSPVFSDTSKIIETLRDQALVKLRKFKGYESSGSSHRSSSDGLIVALVTANHHKVDPVHQGRIVGEKVKEFLSEDSLNTNNGSLPPKYILGGFVIDDLGNIKIVPNPKFAG